MLRALILLGCVAGSVCAQTAVPFASGGSSPPGEFAMPAPLSAPPVMPPPTMVVPPADGGLLPPPPPKIWKGNVEAGVNGATGNTEVLNTRLFWTADRKTDINLFHTDMTYLLGTQNGVTNQNTMILNVRDELLTPGSPWSIYGLTFVDYDDLRDYKFMIGLYGGLGYLVCDDDTTFFKLRGGAGTIYKTGGPSEDLWEPSLNFGFDYKYRFSRRSAFVSVLDYYPSFRNSFSDYLLRFKAAYETTIDPETGMFLRLGIFERYDSNPGPGKDKSDLNYFMTLGFHF